MKPKYLITAAIFLALSCSHKKRSSDAKDTLVVKQPQLSRPGDAKKVSSQDAVDTTRILLSYASEHAFSDPLQKDSFSITLFGSDIDHGFVVFKITDYKQRQIFREEFQSSDLLGDYDDLNPKQQEDTIRVTMAHFFDKSNFARPAVDSADTYENSFEEADQSDKENLDDIKSDKTAVGFIYSHGYEGTFGIAFSKKKDKVVSIFDSD